MDLDRYLESIRRDSDALRAIAQGDLTLTVPSCPGWSLADLFGHVGRVYAMVTAALTSEQLARPTGLPDPPADDAVAAWFDDRTDGLLDAFGSTGPEAQRWNWSAGEQVASFWWRRMAQETAVHLWDAQDALGAAEAIDGELASDGIDEWFDVHLRSDLADPGLVGDVPTLGTLHVHCGDVEGEWWAALDGRELVLERAHKKGDAVLRGGAGDLLLVLWGRASTSTVEVLGDASVVDAWLALPDI